MFKQSTVHLFDLIIQDDEKVTLDEVVLDDANRKTVEQLILEHRFIDEIHKHGLPANNKILLYGSSGCGKTMTAKAIAQALGKKILILNLSNIVSARIGETSQHLKQVFDKAARDKAVLFLDEFDQIGKARGSDDKDVGEMRRLVNTLIQLIDYFPENALLLCATNHPEIVDIALMRRFQLRIEYQKPSQETLNAYYDELQERFPTHLQSFERIYEVSFAEAKDHALTQIKAALIDQLLKEQNA